VSGRSIGGLDWCGRPKDDIVLRWEEVGDEARHLEVPFKLPRRRCSTTACGGEYASKHTNPWVRSATQGR
jgi:hypothetical protein